MSSRTDPLVTVVTPAYNAEKFIMAAIESVLSQSSGDLEHLVVDDHSSDQTEKVVRALASTDDRLRVIGNRFGRGPAGARNTGIRAARGRYIAFLDSDDIWYPDKLQRQLELIRATRAPLVFSSFDLISGDHAECIGSREVPERVDYAKLLQANVIGCLTAMFDRDRAGTPLMPDIRMRQDWGLWLRILRETGGEAISIADPLAALRLRPGSLSSNKVKATWYSFVLLSRVERQGPWRAMRSIIGHNAWRLLSEKRRPGRT